MKYSHVFTILEIAVADLEIQQGGFSCWCAKRSRKFLGRHAHFPSRKSPNWIPRMLEATLDLVKRLEISKELIRECVTVPGCCCCMPLLHYHLMDSCSNVHKNTLLYSRQREGALAPPLPPPKSATESLKNACNSWKCSQLSKMFSLLKMFTTLEMS